MNPSKITYELARCYLLDHRHLLQQQDLDTILSFLEQKNVRSLVSLVGLMGHAYHMPSQRRLLMQMEAFFSKNSSLPAQVDTSAASIVTFHSMERHCRNTNRRVDSLLRRQDPLGAWFRMLTSKIERDISLLLGDFNAFLGDMPAHIRLTSGATNTLSRRQAAPYDKLRRVVSVTPRCAPYLVALYRYFGYRPPRLEYTEWNRVTQVPKNWKTDRTIACEPTGNIPFQLAFDDFVKSKLLSWGIDLSDQSRNQRLALQGSITDDLSTIDLRSASDTLSMNTVAALMPPRWFEFLSAVRCRSYDLQGTKSFYAKFSSMGNGATFGLETLIFASIIRQCSASVYAVYGDDIVIDKACTGLVIRMLNLFGFMVNRDKSFTAGPFRESCGVNAYKGEDVTPFYVRQVDSRKTVLSHLVNGLAPLSHPTGLLARYLVRIVRDNDLLLVPYSLDSTDGVFVTVNRAYSLGLIRTKNSVQSREKYLLRRKQGTRSDSVSLAMWFLQRNYSPYSRQALYTSRNLLLSQKFVRKWTGWIPPAMGTPSYLYWWEDLLPRKRKTDK